MKFIGEYLKNSRIKKKVSLNSVSKNLNISINYLKAIESSDFNKIPGGAYTLGYIRSYSDYLNLDTNYIIDQYKTQISFSDVNEVILPPQASDIFLLFKSYKLISLLAFTSISFLFFYIFIVKTDFLPEYAITTDLTEAEKSEIEKFELKNALLEAKKVNKELIEVQKKELSEFDLLNKDNEFLNDSKHNTAIASVSNDSNSEDIDNLISIKAINPTWIQLRNQKDEIIYSKLMNPNEEYLYSLQDDYLITVGNAGNIIVSFGGKVMGKLGGKGEVLESLYITPDFFSN